MSKQTKTNPEPTYLDRLLELGVMWGVSHDSLKEVINEMYNVKDKQNGGN